VSSQLIHCLEIESDFILGLEACKGSPGVQIGAIGPNCEGVFDSDSKVLERDVSTAIPVGHAMPSG
jgi:hypothetical protein